MSNLSQAAGHGPEETTSLPPSGKKSGGSDARTYFGATIFCFILAFGIFFFAKDPEKTGPPQPQEGSTGALPHDHPDTAMTAALQQLAAHVESMRSAVAENPGNDSLRLNLANSLYDLGQHGNDPAAFTEAVVNYAKYLEGNPKDNDARTDYAYTLFRTGKLDESIAQLYTVRKSDPGHQQAAFNLGLMYKEKDQPDSLLNYMRIAAEIDSTTNAGQAAAQILGAYHEAHAQPGATAP